MATTEPEIKVVAVQVNTQLHKMMKEYAHRKRVTIGLAYDTALQYFLSQTSAYMGKKQQSKLKGVK